MDCVHVLLVCPSTSLVHIELAAVDLSWDIIVRFGTNPSYNLPKAFFDDFVQVGGWVFRPGDFLTIPGGLV